MAIARLVRVSRARPVTETPFLLSPYRGGSNEFIARNCGRGGDLRVDAAAASPRPDLAQRGVVVRVHQLADRLRLVLTGGGVHSRHARGSRARRSHGGPADYAAG